MSQRPLSKEQIRQLGIVRTAAYKHQQSLGLVVLPPDLERASKKDQADFWAHQQIASATQRVCSARDMIDDEYADTMLHFVGLCGPDYAAEKPKRLGKVIEGSAADRAPGCEYLRDMYQWLAKAGYKVGYAIAIAKAKFKGQTDFRQLSEWQLKQLHDTVVNRCRAKLGLGDPANRNKRERSGTRAEAPARRPQTAPVAPPPPPSPAITTATRPAGQKSREYVLKPRDSGDSVPPANIPF